MNNRFVVAVSQKEADGMWDLGRSTRDSAESHLAEVKKPPTDPYYASLYGVYEVLGCNHIHVIKGACLLPYGHDGDHKFNRDLPADRCGGDGTYLPA